MKAFVGKLISRLKEVGKLEISMHGGRCNGKTLALGYAKGIENSIAVVNELAEDYNNWWIPCSERYPDTDNYILLSFENFSVPLVGRYEEDADGGGAFYVGDDSESCISQGIIVNGWMPLMKCYREKGDEENE